MVFLCGIYYKRNIMMGLKPKECYRRSFYHVSLLYQQRSSTGHMSSYNSYGVRYLSQQREKFHWNRSNSDRNQSNTPKYVLQRNTRNAPQRTCKEFNQSKEKVNQSISLSYPDEAIYGAHAVLAALTTNNRQITKTLYIQQSYHHVVKEALNSCKSPSDAIVKAVGLTKLVNKRSNNERVVAEYRATQAGLLAFSNRIEIQYAPKDAINNAIGHGKLHNGLLLDASGLPVSIVHTPEQLELLSVPQHSLNALWIVLDEIHDPHNLGSILRNCWFFGVSGVIVTKSNCAPLRSSVAKSSAGALELLIKHNRLFYVENLVKFLSAFSTKEDMHCQATIKSETFEAGARTTWNVLSTEMKSQCHNHHDLKSGDQVFSKNAIIVLGNEAHGVRTAVSRACRGSIAVPDNIAKNAENSDGLESIWSVDSLNVSCASSAIIALWRCGTRQ